LSLVLLIPIRTQVDPLVGCVAPLLGVLMYALVACSLVLAPLVGCSRSQLECVLEFHLES